MKVLQSHVCLSLSALNAETDLMSLSRRTLTVTSGSSPADASSSDSLLCPYVNLQLMNASPAGGFHSPHTSHRFIYIYTHTYIDIHITPNLIHIKMNKNSIDLFNKITKPKHNKFNTKLN